MAVIMGIAIVVLLRRCTGRLIGMTLFGRRPRLRCVIRYAFGRVSRLHHVGMGFGPGPVHRGTMVHGVLFHRMLRRHRGARLHDPVNGHLDARFGRGRRPVALAGEALR